MAINLISPGIKVTETDQVASVRVAGTTVGGFAGKFTWGPVEQAVLVSSEGELVETFGAPNVTTAVDFLSAANFLAYGSSLQVVRAANTTGALNATAEATTGSATAGTGISVKNDAAYESYVDGSADVGPWIAKYPGVVGNSLKVSTCPSPAAWQSSLTGTFTVAAGSTTVVGVGSSANTELTVGDIVVLGGRSIQVASITNATHFTLESKHLTGATGATAIRRWEFFGSFDQAPGTSPFARSKRANNDEMHVAVVDEDGLITGTRNTLLEKYQAVSKGSDAKNSNGGNNYYKSVINDRSKYIRWTDHDSQGTNWGSVLTSGLTFTAVTSVKNYSLAGGADGAAATDGQIINALGVFENKSNLPISVMPLGAASATVINYAIGVAEERKDFVVCFSPEYDDVINNVGDEANDIETFADTVTASTYGIMDGNWKYQYNKYLDSYVFVPCNADVAGLLARTDRDRAPWFSPAGYTNGNILNVVKLAWNPNEAERDILYKRSVNPIFTQPGRGTVLFGDKTFVTSGGSFSRINVRRLFITIRGAIGSFAENVLFEQNDVTTRSAFVDAVEPYLRSVAGARGISEFAIVCDETNNTDAVVNANEFVADIFVRPIASINFIQLNFVSVSGASAIAELAG
jgi:hypothetical protein